MYKGFYLQASFSCSVIIYTNVGFHLPLNLSFLEHSHIDSLFMDKVQKKASLWHNTFATNAGLIHHITDMDCWVQDGSTDSDTRSRAIHNSKCQFVTNDKKSSKQIAVCFFSFFKFLCHWQGRWCFTDSVPLYSFKLCKTKTAHTSQLHACITIHSLTFHTFPWMLSFTTLFLPPPTSKLIHTHNQKIEVTTVSLAHLLWLVLVEFWTESSLWWLHWRDTLSLWESFLVHLAPWPRLLLHLLSTRQMASPAAGLFRKGCGDQWSAQERPDKQSKETTPKH